MYDPDLCADLCMRLADREAARLTLERLRWSIYAVGHWSYSLDRKYVDATGCAALLKMYADIRLSLLHTPADMLNVHYICCHSYPCLRCGQQVGDFTFTCSAGTPDIIWVTAKTCGHYQYRLTGLVTGDTEFVVKVHKQSDPSSLQAGYN